MRISDWSSDVCSSDLLGAVSPCRAERRCGSLQLLRPAGAEGARPVARKPGQPLMPKITKIVEVANDIEDEDDGLGFGPDLDDGDDDDNDGRDDHDAAMSDELDGLRTDARPEKRSEENLVGAWGDRSGQTR